MNVPIVSAVFSHGLVAQIHGRTLVEPRRRSVADFSVLTRLFGYTHSNN